MTSRRPGYVLAIAVVATAGALAVPDAARGIDPTVRYASPAGVDSADCLQATPCGLVTAINQAPANSEVVVEPGTYGSASAPITTRIADSHGALYVHGVAGQPMPGIYEADPPSGNPMDFHSAGSVLRDVEIISTATGYSITLENGEADHIILDSTNAKLGTCYLASETLVDSVCHSAVANGIAIITAGGVDTVRGVTAIASGGDGTALEANAFEDVQITETVTNSILLGNGTPSAGGDVVAIANSPGVAHIAIDHSDCVSSKPLGNGATITDGGGNVTAVPSFVDAPTGNYQEAVGSPTIDKGAPDPGGDTTDVAGNARTQGAAPDIGAYEFASPKVVRAPKKPTAHDLNVGKKTAHGAKLTVKVNPDGLATKVKLIAAHGKHHITSTPVSAGSGTATKTVHLALHGLKAHTKYKVYAVATSSAGHTNSTKKTFVTHKKPHKK